MSVSMSDYELDETTGEAPVELYRFVRGATVWTYTSGDQTRVLNGELYTPAAITRGTPNNSDEATSDTIDVVVPRDLDVAAQFVAGPPPEPVVCTVYRAHRNAPTTVGVLIAGEVSAAAFNQASVTLTCDGVAASLTRSMPRVVYQSTCNNSLYDGRCQVSKAAFRVADTITAINGLAITVAHAADQADGYYAGGLLEFDIATGFIESHVGNVVTLMYPVAGLTVGASVNLLPGCDKRTATCLTKFDNIAHFAGFPTIPTVNPFSEGIG